MLGRVVKLGTFSGVTPFAAVNTVGVNVDAVMHGCGGQGGVGFQ